MTDLQSPLMPQLPISQGDVLYWEKLYGAAKGLAIANAVIKQKSPVILITENNKAMENMLEEIQFFQDAQAPFPVLSFPDWEVLPYDIFSPYQDIISERIKTLFQIISLDKGLIVTTASTVMGRLMPVDYLAARSMVFKKDDELILEAFKSQLLDYGYKSVLQVSEHGEFAFRGSILDVFPMGSSSPFRMDLLDNSIDSIRLFDTETQKSFSKINEINILPANEMDYTDDGINRFRKNWRETFERNPLNSEIYVDVSNKLSPQGIEFYLPLFFDCTSSIFEYFKNKPVILFDSASIEAMHDHWQSVSRRYDTAVNEMGRMVLKPDDLYVSPDRLLESISSFSQIHIRTISSADHDDVASYSTKVPLHLKIDARLPDPLGLFKKYLHDFGGKVLLVAESPGRRESLLALLKSNELSPKLVQSWREFISGDYDFCLTVSPLENGALIGNPAIAIVSESQLFGERVYQRRLRKRRQNNTDALIRNLAELSIGDPIVHEENGVGRYKGLIELTINGITNEFIHLEYYNQDKLYVPVSSLNLVSRYTGADAEHAPLHRLGSGQWQKIRDKAEKRVFDVAAELLDLHAKRAARSGIAFTINQDEYSAFIQGFPFEETPDQEDAIIAVLEDMKLPKAMDRLICGDAGFGKTEVAMRAAYVCVSNNKQVALLVPTTLLAQQHYENFKDRFADWPIKIEVMSRFVGKNEQKQIVENIANGKVDIVIGTHRLLQDDIKYKDLGLLIIDEEHRFGVRQKEKIKAFRSEVEILTLTATPIPRTLNLAISELRDLSIIATAPSRRHAVKTFMCEWNSELLVEAMQREIKRGGQVYFLHNEVSSIAKMAERIQKLLPDARVKFAHGQMPERQLEEIMQDFYHRRFNILVCTTIIESGIDVPSANTIIINRADKLGLAQLYQLRGRVGRSHHHSFAYLLVPSMKEITKDAMKRLQAVESMEELGIGFTLAIHDLEIRGAGEILGDEQSGQIHEIGYSLYIDLLERAVTALRDGKQPKLDRSLDHGVEVEIHAPTLIPSNYLPDVHTRLIMYKKIAAALSQDDLDLIMEEMVDRFGVIPDSTKTLFEITKMKLKVQPLGISKIDLGPNGGRIIFNKNTNVNSAIIIKLITEYSDIYKLDGAEKLRIIKAFDDVNSRLEFLLDLFEVLTTKDAA
jgi:transcription-repair coupling factor (superfamily II helicase)